MQPARLFVICGNNHVCAAVGDRAIARLSDVDSRECNAAQVLGKVTIAFGVFAFIGVLVILIVLLARGEPVGYAFVVSTGPRPSSTIDA